MEELDGCELSALNTLVTTFYFYEREGFVAVQNTCHSYDIWPSDAPLFYDPPEPSSAVVRLDGGRREEIPQHTADRALITSDAVGYEHRWRWPRGWPGQEVVLRAIHAMHEAEDAGGFVRSFDETQRIHSGPGVVTLVWGSDVSVQYWRPRAYLILGGKGPEAGGEPGGVRALIHHALSHWDELMPAAAPPPSSDVISGTTGDTDRGDLNAQTGDYMQAVLGTALTAFGYTQPTVLGDILEAVVPHRRRPFQYDSGSGMMVRVNNARQLLAKLAAGGALPAGEAFSLSVDGEAISFEPDADGGWSLGDSATDGSRHAELSKTQLTALLFGSHIARLTDLDGVPAWVHAALRWVGGSTPVWRFDTS